MDKQLKKYNTKCYDIKTGELLQEKEYEGIDQNEAKTRAYLNCLNLACDDDISCDRDIDKQLAKKYNLKVDVDEI